MTELDKAVDDSKKPDERELPLRFYLLRLKKHAGLCSNAANEILQRHVRFASLMAQWIDDASKSQYDLKYDYSETTRLANDISEASRSLSIYVTDMTYDLDSFVSALKKVQVAVEKEPSWTEWFLGWLKYLLKAIVKIVAIISTPISEALHRHSNPNVRRYALAVTALGHAAAIFCTMDSEDDKGKEPKSLDSIIIFLKEIVPREAQNAQKKLGRFDEALYIMGLEDHMKEGRRVTLSGRLAAVAKEWRDVAEAYECQLGLLDDKDPALDQKKLCS